MTSLTVDCDPITDDLVDLFGKSASDLQENIVVGDDAISGTLKYIEDYSSAFGGDLSSGNYIALIFDTPDVTGATITVEIVGGVSGPVTLDPDRMFVGRIADKSTQTIQVVASKEGYESVTKVYSLTGLTLEAASGSGLGG